MPTLNARCVSLAFALLLGTVPAVEGAAQESAGSRWMATRPELESALQSSEQLVNSSAYGARLRARAAGESSAIRSRLRDGDFKVGDRMMIRVEGEVAFDDTVTVDMNSRITVPGYGAVSLLGVLRSELQPRVQAAFRELVLNADVTTRPLTRIAVFGAVGAPGYQLVTYEARLDELLTLAGGPSVESRPEKFELMRGDTVVMKATEVASAIASGRTVGELQLRDGDYLMVEPRTPPWDRSSTISIVSLFVGPAITFLLLR